MVAARFTALCETTVATWLSLSLKVDPGSRYTLSEWDFLPCPCRSPGCLPEARPAMQSAAGPPGGSNPKRATGRSHRSADGASPAALDRSPRELARPAHAHGLASTATFGGAICAFIALWILLAPIGLFPTVGGAHSVHFESDSLFGRHALRQKVAAGCPRRASQLPARMAASFSRPASTSTRSSFCRCVLVASRAAVKVCPDERQAIARSLFALCIAVAGLVGEGLAGLPARLAAHVQAAGLLLGAAEGVHSKTTSMVTGGSYGPSSS